MGPRALKVAVFLAMMSAMLVVIILTGAGASKGGTITLTSDEEGRNDLVGSALANATHGDTIKLTKGLYFEGDLVMDKEVRIEGEADVYLLARSAHITADNVTISSLTMALDPGHVEIDGDNWTIDVVAFQECIDKMCIRTVGTSGGVLRSSTIIGASQDAVQGSWVQDLTIEDCFVYAPYVAMRFDNMTGLSMENVRAAQAYVGLYLSWSRDVTSTHSVYDTRGWGMLVANSTNMTIDDSLLFSTSSGLSNYGVYVAFGDGIDIENCTFNSDAAGIALYKSVNVTARWNTVFGNIEGVWSVGSDYLLRDNAIFENLRAGLNTTGGSADVKGNYWGTTSLKTAMSMVRGDVDASAVEPVRLSDTTPDAPPTMTSDVPDVIMAVEDAASVTVHDIGQHFADDTWYVYAYIPSPSKVRFEVIYNSDPDNVTLRVSEETTCAGTCPDVEGELRVSTSANWYGEVRVKVRGYDWRGKHVDSNTFRVVFVPVNDRPVMSIKDVPKNSRVELGADEKKELEITVHDDSVTTYIEIRWDEEGWERVEGDLVCLHDNGSRTRDLPRCNDKVVVLKAPSDLRGGEHVLAFRACDGEMCSDEVYTGMYEVELDYEGLEGRAFSPEGAMVALVLLVLVGILAFAVMPRRKPDTNKGGERRGGKGASREEKD